MQEHENHVDDVQMRQTDESWWMMSQTSHTKTITQINCTTESHGIGLCMAKNGNHGWHFLMLQSYSGAYGDT